MAGPLVDAHHRLLGRPRGEAEDLARLRIEPCALVDHALVVLDRQVAVVRLRELLGADAKEPVVDIHELAHCIPPCLMRLVGTASRFGLGTADAIGRATDGLPPAMPNPVVSSSARRAPTACRSTGRAPSPA